MTKLYTFALVAAMSATMYAQNSYDAANFAVKDLNGTARFVGMGGALSALGGDVSVMSTNPAGTAMYRKNDVAFSLSTVSGAAGVLGHDRTRMSLDNAGILISLPTDEGDVKYVNIGFNYVKAKNFLFNQNTPVENLSGTYFDQNNNPYVVNYSQTNQIANYANNSYNDDVQFGASNSNWGALGFMAVPNYDDQGNKTKYGILAETYDTQNNFIGFSGIGALDANMRKASYGGTTQADVNLSFNVLDKYFFGASVGLYDIDYTRESFYEELMSVNDQNGNPCYYDFSNWYTTNGDGLDVKLGFICRPVDDSPFRIGVAVHTPTWYRLEDASGSTLYLNDQYVSQLSYDPYQYNYRTPWKFGLSLGHTVGNYFAIGAEYEYQDLSTAHYSENGRETEYFRLQNQFIKNNLKGQSTFKIGMEVKPTNAFSVRCGYNFVSAPFKSDAFNILNYYSVATETDYTNWKAINRYTFGLGYRFKGGYFDLAYQYSGQKGDFYAFDEVDLKPTEIKNNRSQVMATLGFRF